MTWKLPAWANWAMGATLVLLMVGVPYKYYRHRYEAHKRIRAITDGLVYRSGCMTEPGMRETIRKHKIKTVINFQEEAPDPVLPAGLFGKSGLRESQIVAEEGAKMISLTVDVVHPPLVGSTPNAVLAEFYRIMDDPASYPVLLHCRAGLHRTGCMSAVYRMEYEGWSKHEALRELKALGFGFYPSSRENDYIEQYIHQYQPRANRPTSTPRAVPGVLTSRPKE